MTTSTPNHPPPGSTAPRGGFLVLVMLTLLLFIIHLTGPSNLMDNDQERPASYVMDVVLHGHWWCQTDWTGDIMSKPPLFTWIAALATFPMGHADLGSLYFPCLLAMLLVVGLLFHFGRNHFGWAAGFLAGLMYLVSPAGFKHIALARTDGLFAATIALTALLGFRAWQRGRGWIWFWIAAALATLTKGPLGPVLAAMGLLAVIWEKWDRRKSAQPPPAGRPNTSSLDCNVAQASRLPGNEDRESDSVSTASTTGADGKASLRFWTSQFVGLALFLLIAGGWFWLAYQQSGQAFIDKVIGRELVGHVVGSENGKFGIGFVLAPLYWLSRFLPWSLITLVALWRVWKHSATDASERCFERFLFCWLLGGLLLFSLATHQRGDLPLPLDPAAALLAGRELARWLDKWQSSQLLQRSLATAIAALGCYTVYLHTVFARTEEVRQSEGIEALAGELARDSSLPPLLHVDSPYALQFHLNTMDRCVTFEQAAKALKSDQPCAVAVRNASALQEAVGNADALYRIASWPGGEQGDLISVYSNQPK